MGSRGWVHRVGQPFDGGRGGCPVRLGRDGAFAPSPLFIPSPMRARESAENVADGADAPSGASGRAPSQSARIGATLKTSSMLVTPRAALKAPLMRRGRRPFW